MESLLQVVLYLSPLLVLAGYVYIRKDAIIENVKSKVMESVLPGGLGGALGGLGGGSLGLPVTINRST